MEAGFREEDMKEEVGSEAGFKKEGMRHKQERTRTEKGSRIMVIVLKGNLRCKGGWRTAVQVSSAYIAYAHEDDVDGFMASLGFGTGERVPPGADFEAGLREAFLRALSLTEPARCKSGDLRDQLLASATRARLIEWGQEYEFLLSMFSNLQ